MATFTTSISVKFTVTVGFAVVKMLAICCDEVVESLLELHAPANITDPSCSESPVTVPVIGA